MPYYRKKPVIIEAVQWDGDNLGDVCALAMDSAREINVIGLPNNQMGIDITTLEGTMTARLGDYIIKGVKGELYPCKPDIFAATYEEADHDQA